MNQRCCAPPLGPRLLLRGLGNTNGLACIDKECAIARQVVAVYFIVLFVIANQTPCDATAEPSGQANALGKTRLSAASAPLKKEEIKEEGAGSFTLNQLASALAVSAGVCLVADKIVTAFALSGWMIPIATALIIFCATLFPSQLSGLQAAGEAAGVMCMQLFFAATGAAGSIRIVLATAPILFAFSALHLALHLAILLGLGKLFYRSASEGGKVYIYVRVYICVYACEIIQDGAGSSYRGRCCQEHPG